MLGRYDRAMRSRHPVGGQTLLARAIAAIRRNNGALFYVPANFAGAWTDSAGTDLVNEVADVLGLMTDRSYGANNLGPELVTNGGFDNGLAGWKQLIGTASVVSGAARVVTPNSNQPGRLVAGPLTCTVGRMYRCTVKCVQGTASGADITIATRPTSVSGALLLRGNTGTVDSSFVFTATQTQHWIFLESRSGTAGTYSDFDNVSVREVFGAVATQATTANKPTVRMVPKRLGPNLVSNGGFDSGLTGWTRGSTGTQTHESGAIRVVGDSATTWSGISETTIPVLIRGKQYLVQFSVLAENTSSGAGLHFRTSSLAIGGLFANGLNYFYPSAVGNYSVLFTATVDNINKLRIIAGIESNSSVLFDNISVQEVLEWSYAMSFDGSNDSLTTNITTGNEGWICAGVTFGATSLQTVAASGASNNSEKGVCLLLLNSTTLMGQASNGTIRAQPSMPITVNTPQVVSMGWSGAVVMVGVGNTESAPVALAGDMTGAQLLRFGNHQSSGWPMNGPMTAQVICPVLPSAADRAIIRKWIGSLQGQTL